MPLTPLTVDYPLLCERDEAFARLTVLKFQEDELVKLGGSFRYGIHKEQFLKGTLDPDMVRWLFRQSPLEMGEHHREVPEDAPNTLHVTVAF